MLVLAVAVAIAAALALSGSAQLAVLSAVLVLGGAGVGQVRLAAIDRPAERIRGGERVALRGVLLTAPRPNPFGASAELRVGGGRLGGARLLVRAPRWAPFPRGATIGAELSLEGRLRRLVARPRSAPGRETEPHFDYAAHLRRHGVAGELLVDGARVTGRRRGGVPGLLDGMRQRAERGVAAGMEPSDRALLRGMVLGQDDAIEPATRDDFRDSGLAHLLAVSGQNVMLLAALALPALVLAGLGRRGRLAALAGLIAVYVPLAGAGPSLQRAGIMGIAGIAAVAASRPASRWYALLLAAVLTLAWNPRAWTDPGWQLSFAAVAGILVLGVPLRRVLRRTADELVAPTREPGAPPAPLRGWTRRLRRSVIGALVDGVAITVAATLATAPLLGHHFGSVPVVGLGANLLALPAVAPAMWLGMVKIALGQAGAVGAVLAGVLGPVSGLPVGYLAWLAERCADAPGGQVALPLRSPAALLAAYLAMAVVAVIVWRSGARLGPRLVERAASWRRLPRALRAALVAAALAAVALGMVELLRTPGPPAHFTVRFLDVGQGDATLIQAPDGTAVLFDGGPPEAGVTRLVRRAGVARLALVVATHASRDHHGGLTDVLRRFRVDALLDGGDGARDPGFRAVLREAAARGVARVRAVAPLDLSLADGRVRIQVLSPPPRPPGPPSDDPNPRAVVAVVSAGRFDLLLSADAESEALLPLQLPDVEAIKVPHHGSSDPGLPELLERLDPEVAAIEVGPNTYGHPAPSTLTALDRAGVTTYRTDRDGSVTLTVDDGRVRVDTER